MREHSDEYLAYMQSDKWRLTRMEALGLAGGKCARCGTTEQLEVHHLTYERLGQELPADLTVLCLPDHKAAHAEADRLRRYQARLNGWASRRYGVEWAERIGYEDVAAEFDDWLWVNDEAHR